MEWEWKEMGWKGMKNGWMEWMEWKKWNGMDGRKEGNGTGMEWGGRRASPAAETRRHHAAGTTGSTVVVSFADQRSCHRCPRPPAKRHEPTEPPGVRPDGDRASMELSPTKISTTTTVIRASAGSSCR